jgi:hypothetical protein
MKDRPARERRATAGNAIVDSSRPGPSPGVRTQQDQAGDHPPDRHSAGAPQKPRRKHVNLPGFSARIVRFSTVFRSLHILQNAQDD